MIDTTPGEKISADICEECKEKIEKEMAKLSKLDLLRPRKLAIKFAGLLCVDCQERVKKTLGKK